MLTPNNVRFFGEERETENAKAIEKSDLETIDKIKFC